jgi:hypothetical protein
LSSDFEANSGVFAQQVAVEGLAKGQYMLRVLEQNAQGSVLHSTRFVR